MNQFHLLKEGNELTLFCFVARKSDLLVRLRRYWMKIKEETSEASSNCPKHHLVVDKTDLYNQGGSI